VSGAFGGLRPFLRLRDDSLILLSSPLEVDEMYLEDLVASDTASDDMMMNGSVELLSEEVLLELPSLSFQEDLLFILCPFVALAR
jgi:hypothetical protein